VTDSYFGKNQMIAFYLRKVIKTVVIFKIPTSGCRTTSAWNAYRASDSLPARKSNVAFFSAFLVKFKSVYIT
jgi:hypothetical protein